MQTLNSNATSLQNIFKRMLPGFSLGILVFIGLTLLGGFHSVGSEFYDFNWKVFPIVIGFTLFNYLLRFFKWHFYLGQSGVNLPFLQSLRLFMAGFPLEVTPGKVGEVLKGIWLKKLTGLPVDRGISVVLAERISDGFAVLILTTLGVIAFPQYWPVFLVVFLILITILVASQIRPVATYFLDAGSKWPLIQNYIPGLRELYEGGLSLFRPVATLFAVLLAAISWLGGGVAFYFILITFGLPADEKTLFIAIFVLSFSTFIGGLSGLPGGLGVTEVTIAGMLTLLCGLEPGIASVATLLIRLATLWFGVALGLITWTFSIDLLGLRTEHGKIIEG
ncbi:MAG: lysylphosphatidylglycerol synthase transmembrane domain-containing protein [Anaerolineaceae bacterium]